MTTPPNVPPESASEDRAFGRLLKFWRGVHGVSQEQLALSLDSSTRHISFMENGKAQPSKEMVENIARVLALGGRDTSQLLIAAGYVPAAQPVDFQAPELRWLRKAMTLTLRALDPFPTTVSDAAGNILMVNRGWVGCYSRSIPRAELDQVTNHFDFLFNSKDRELTDAWLDTLSVFLMSLQQSALLSDDRACLDKLQRLQSHPDVPADWRQRAAKLEPMASYRVQVRVAGQLRPFYNVSQMVGAVGPAAYVSEPRLTISTLYPDDESLDLSNLIQEPLEHALLLY